MQQRSPNDHAAPRSVFLKHPKKNATPVATNDRAMPEKDEVEYDEEAREETKAYSDFNMAKSVFWVLLLLECLELLEDFRGAFWLPEVELLPFLPVPFLPNPLLPDPFLPLDSRLVGLNVASRPVLLQRTVGRLEATQRDGAGDDTLTLATSEGVGDDIMGNGVDVGVGSMTLSRIWIMPLQAPIPTTTISAYVTSLPLLPSWGEILPSPT